MKSEFQNVSVSTEQEYRELHINASLGLQSKPPKEERLQACWNNLISMSQSLKIPKENIQISFKMSSDNIFLVEKTATLSASHIKNSIFN